MTGATQRAPEDEAAPRGFVTPAEVAIVKLEGELKRDHARLEGEIKVVREEVKNLKWYAGLAAAAAVALIKLLP